MGSLALFIVGSAPRGRIGDADRCTTISVGTISSTLDEAPDRSSVITLYSRVLCPYCRRVRRTLDDLCLEYEERRVSVLPPLRGEVKAISDQWRVPVLVDEAQGLEGLAGSADIVRYLEETYGGGNSCRDDADYSPG